MNGVVNFTYIKKDGKVRHACGTLYGIGHTIKGTGKGHECSYTLRYYDVDCKGWRSFIIGNLQEVGELRKGTIEEHHDICIALVVKLKEKMDKEGTTAFAYRKADGSIRYAHGFALESIDLDSGIFVYFDTDKGEKRQFRIDSFIGFGEFGEIDELAAVHCFEDSRKYNISGNFHNNSSRNYSDGGWYYNHGYSELVDYLASTTFTLTTDSKVKPSYFILTDDEDATKYFKLVVDPVSNPFAN